MNVRQLYVLCEGQTEEEFAGRTLGAHFGGLADIQVVPLLLLNKRNSTARRHKGGLVDYAKAKSFLLRIMAEHHRSDSWFTTMFDLYALPTNFPGHAISPLAPPIDRVRHLESAFRQDVVTDALWRFTPYLQLHEFEALLLVEPVRIAEVIVERRQEVDALAQSLGPTDPEDVDEGPLTAPSKRIISFVPEYEGLKAIAGPLVAEHIGLAKLRERCPHFHDWLSELERVATQTT